MFPLADSHITTLRIDSNCSSMPYTNTVELNALEKKNYYLLYSIR